MREMNTTMNELVKGMKVRTAEKTIEKSHEMAEHADEVASILGQSLGVGFVDEDEVDECLERWFEEDAVFDIDKVGEAEEEMNEPPSF